LVLISYIAPQNPSKLHPIYQLAQVDSLSAAITTTLQLAQAAMKLLREKQVKALPAWQESAQASSVRGESCANLPKGLSGIARQ
jgi:hypothetical protein